MREEHRPLITVVFSSATVIVVRSRWCRTALRSVRYVNDLITRTVSVASVGGCRVLVVGSDICALVWVQEREGKNKIDADPVFSFNRVVRVTLIPRHIRHESQQYVVLIQEQDRISIPSSSEGPLAAP